MTQEQENPSVIFLKSTAHVRILDKQTNWLKSSFTGIQFSLMFPYEIYLNGIKPLFAAVFGGVFNLVRVIALSAISAAHALYCGFSGRLEATEFPNEIFDEIQNAEDYTRALIDHGKSFDKWWEAHGKTLLEGHGKQLAHEAWMHAAGFDVTREG